MASAPRPHLFVPSRDPAIAYTRPPSGGGAAPLPKRDRQKHGEALKAELEQARSEGQERRRRARVVAVAEPTGIILQLRSEPGFELALDRLDLPSQDISLLAVRRADDCQEATLRVPDKKIGVLLRRIEEYLTLETAKGNPKNRLLVESISALRLATLEALWTDDRALYPTSDDTLAWWEIWLRHDEHAEGMPALDRLRALAAAMGFAVDDRSLRFPDRVVVIAAATPRTLSASLDIFDDIAELRVAKCVTRFFTNLSPREQGEWVREFAGRIRPAPVDAPAVCLLDTGLQHGHPLFSGSVGETDAHSIDPAWGAQEDANHGTLMAGLALFGDLGPLLQGREELSLVHRLESVQILPPAPLVNRPENYGAITLQAVGLCELAAPFRSRAIALAVTTDGRDHGRPSAWSAEIDTLASGYDGGALAPPRLLFVSAGNRTKLYSSDFFAEAMTDGIQSPGQSWNALTIGACTDRVQLDDPSYAGWHALATRPGDLSPHSTTSVTWDAEWPVKPELVFEGGNVAINPADGDVAHPDALCLLSTTMTPDGALLARMNGTSAATALAAGIGATLQAEYPKAWPETIRGILVHSARWSGAMHARVADLKGRKRVQNLVRSFGYGTPDLTRARSSFRNALTLIVQDELQPYEADATKDMRFHRLPWPRQELAALAESPVTLRVILSYFIEPNPGDRGWKYKHRYASHGLRFDMRTPTESEEEFCKRINGALREDDEGATPSDAERWTLGPDLRSAGSLHVDMWEGSGAELALRDTIAVYPVVGWWRERHQLGRSRNARYSLIVSIETPVESVELYAAVENLLKVEVPVGAR